MHGLCTKKKTSRLEEIIIKNRIKLMLEPIANLKVIVRLYCRNLNVHCTVRDRGVPSPETEQSHCTG